MNLNQKGFTLIELMIVLAVIGILASLAIPAYQSYTVRAQVSEGLNLSSPLQTAVTEYFNDNGGFPTGNDDAGVAAAGAYVGKYVDSISIDGADISIQYGNDASAQISGETVTLTAVSNLGSMSWSCASGGVIADVFLPSSCR